MAPHLRCEVPHTLDDPPGPRREILAEDVVGPGGDLHHEVVGTLELGHDPQHGEQEAQVGSHRCLQQDLPVDQFLDLRVESVDDLLAIEQNLQYLIVTGQKRLGRPGQVLGDQGEQFDDLGLDALEVVLKFLSALAHGKSLLGS